MPFVFASVFAFIGGLVTKLANWFFTAYLVGSLKTTAIYLSNIIVISWLVYNFVQFANGYLTNIVNNMSPIGQMIVVPIASMLPTNMPYYVTAILTYYTMSITAHITLEIAKFKAKWAENATKSIKV